jgi:hypothetical protein
MDPKQLLASTVQHLPMLLSLMTSLKADYQMFGTSMFVRSHVVFQAAFFVLSVR